MLLGARRLNKRILAVAVGLCATFSFVACGSSKKTTGPTTSGITTRVLASQSVTTNQTFGGLVLIDGYNDTLPRRPPIGAGSSPGLMAITPSRNIVATFDSSSDTVFAVDTARESGLGSVRIPGLTTSIVLPTSAGIGYAAVPNATINGFSFQGAVAMMNFLTGQLTTIAVPSAQTVVSNATGSQILVFSNDSDSMTILSPGVAVPPVDTSCYTSPNTSVCTIVPGFSRPVYAIVSGSTAYILNCGLQCGGSQSASIAIFDLPSLTITKTIPVDAATWALMSGSTLYVAGTSPTNHACTGQQTAATVCGRLDVVDLGSGTVTATYVITDGYHWRMDMTANYQLFIGSHNCTNIGNVNIGGGEIRGCLTILDTVHNKIIIPGDNGDVDGLLSFNSRYIEYVAQGGNLRVYTTYSFQDGLLINGFLQFGTINIVGYVDDIKAIDFF
jgi:hypothetical protein